MESQSHSATARAIRRIRANEALELRQLRLRALEDAPEAFGSTLAGMDAQPESFWRERAARTSSGGEQCMFIAVEGSHWLGMAGAFFVVERPGKARVVSMWVDPSVRRRGVAQGLLEAVTDWAKSHGATQVQLWVTQTNAPAVAPYRRAGFKATGNTQPHPSYSWLREVEMAK